MPMAGLGTLLAISGVVLLIVVVWRGVIGAADPDGGPLSGTPTGICLVAALTLVLLICTPLSLQRTDSHDELDCGTALSLRISFGGYDRPDDTAEGREARARSCSGVRSVRWIAALGVVVLAGTAATVAARRRRVTLLDE